MKVLLDTNVLASAVATRGLCADVFREVLAKHELIVCPQILAELRRILRSKFAVPQELSYLGLLEQDAIRVPKSSLPPVKLNDKDDLGILAAAKHGNAQVLVTGDKELQNLGQFSGIKILSPRHFWEQLTAEEPI